MKVGVEKKQEEIFFAFPFFLLFFFFRLSSPLRRLDANDDNSSFFPFSLPRERGRKKAWDGEIRELQQRSTTYHV